MESRISASIQSSSLSRDGSVELYSGVCSIPLSLGGYEVQEKESDDALEVYVKMSLGVLWGDNKNSVQIQRGSFLVEQKSPFLNYSDIAYAMSLPPVRTKPSIKGKSVS